MLRLTCGRSARLLAIAVPVLLAAGVAPAGASTVPAEEPNLARAAWLLQRGSLETLALTGVAAQSDEFGGGGAAIDPAVTAANEGRRGGALPVLASLVLPGAGEAMLGHKRGYFMMALDILAWTQVAKNHSDGNDLRDEYYAFADAHYSDERLLAAFVDGGLAVDDFYRDGIGPEYFELLPIATIEDLDNLPLYVTAEEDRREYYENLGKWNQFVFGWDDFVRPDDTTQTPPGYTPTWDQKIDLEQPWISANRDAYRLMRDSSNEAFKTRDRWLTLNIGLRVFSVLQTAWLDGLLGGGGGADDGENRLSVAGHDVRLIAQPSGLRRATIAAAITF